MPLDEMMRNLKKGANQKRSEKIEAGELVVRADGSEAIKVKSKKRRSVQPKEESEKKSIKRKVVIIAGVIGVLLLSVITFSVLLGYFNGNRFKSKVSETIVNISGADVELGKLDISADSAKLTKIDLNWLGGSTVLKSLRLEGVNADYGVLAFIGTGWSGSTVGVERAELKLEMEQSNPRLNTNIERPVDFKFDLYQCSILDVDFGKGSLWDFKGGMASYRQSEEGEGQFSVDGGKFTVPMFGVFNVKNGLLSFKPNQAELYLGLESEDHSGILNLDGTCGYTKGDLVELKTDLQDYSLNEWVDPKVRRFLSGKILSGEGTFKVNVGDIDSFDILTKLKMRELRVNDFEFISTIAQLLEDSSYTSPVFRGKSTLIMRRSKGVSAFTDIDLKQKSLMRIKGNFRIDENNLMTGSLKVGLPVMVLATKNGKEIKKVFAEDDGEYVWADVNLGGEVSLPADDLDEQFKSQLIKRGDQVPSFERKFEDLTK